jgi:hypothetical protein
MIAFRLKASKSGNGLAAFRYGPANYGTKL